MKILVALLTRYLVKRARKSATAWIAGAITAAGATAAINPELLELIPEQWRGYAISGIGVAVLAARFRREFMAELRDEKAKAGK